MGSFFKACSSAHSLPRPRGIPEHGGRDEGRAVRENLLYSPSSWPGRHLAPQNPKASHGGANQTGVGFPMRGPCSHARRTLLTRRATLEFAQDTQDVLPSAGCLPRTLSGRTGFTGTLHIQNALQSWASSTRSCKKVPFYSSGQLHCSRWKSPEILS